MTVLLRSTSGGRKRLMVRKQMLLFVITLLIWAMIYGIEIYRTVEQYGIFRCLNAPAYSLKLFSGSLSLGWIIVLYYAAKLLVMIGVGELCVLISSRCIKNRIAVLACSVALLIPVALAAIGSGIGEYISFLLPLGGAEFFW